MELKIKLLKWSAGLPVTMINEITAKKIGVHTKDRVAIKTLKKSPKEISTIINTTKGLVRKNEIAVSSELKKRLCLRVGQKVDVKLDQAPKSIVFINKKLNKKKLSSEEIDEIIKDIVDNSLSEPEIALFISAMYNHGMNMKETISLIKAILKTGNKISFKNEFVVDKHCIGGVSGNRTTPIVVSICAAAGLLVPKNSSKAITSAAGTADVIETVAKIEFSIKELKKIVKKTNACIVWGGALGMVPADSKIIKVEKMLKIDPEAQLIASIISKKLAGGSKYILIDIPYGKNAKVDKAKALRLKKKFEQLGKYFNKKLKCVLTDGSQPIGNGIGPALELVDVLKVLDPAQEGPKDLEKRSLFLAGQLLKMTNRQETNKESSLDDLSKNNKSKKIKGIQLAKEILYSGKAFKKFKQIIKAQQGKLNSIHSAKFKKHILSKKSGEISEINNKKISSLARIAGCPIDKFSGLYLYFHVGDKVKKREKILTIYSESRARLKHAVDFYEKEKPIKIR
ncbi:thymidine phosphorylase [Candidatus Pacearchaeota archaeon]|nr:thymidine phosphorylase [Candidatus Pacearchaeota archaeon]